MAKGKALDKFAEMFDKSVKVLDKSVETLDKSNDHKNGRLLPANALQFYLCGSYA
jgi:hypothetical protein